MKKHEEEQGKQGPAADGDGTAPATSSPETASAPTAEQSASVAARPTAVRRAPAAASTATAADVANHYSEVLVAHHDRGGPITEQFRALRTHLLAHFNDQRFNIIVTSSDAGEGKTVTVLNLAVTLAERVERTSIVVDCDMRKGRVASYLKLSKVPGMSDVIRGNASIDAVVQPTAYSNLWVIPSGEARQHEVGNLVGRPEVEEIAAELRRRYDYVLYDTPPINRAADAGMLGQATDGALMVVRMNKTHRESVDRAIRLLHAATVPVVGLVLTHQKFYIPNYLYRYS
jgi:capsular exopolysaccharide synthesis family protein